jgi:glutathione S-transferase
MIIVHHLNNSRSQRIIWLLEELGVPYEVKRYERDAKTMLAPPELRAVHPLGKSPVITHGSRTIAETGAIVEYIIDEFGQGRLIPPAGTEERLRYTYWLHFAEGSAMPPLVMTLLFGEMPKRMPALIRPVGRMIGSAVDKSYLRPMLDAQMALMEAELGRGGWFAGDMFTAADVMMSFPVEAASSRGGLGDNPRLKEWLGRIHARPAYQAALKAGGEYAYAAPQAA